MNLKNFAKSKLAKKITAGIGDFNKTVKKIATSAAVEIGSTTRGKKSLSVSAVIVSSCNKLPSPIFPDFIGKIFVACKKNFSRTSSRNPKIILCEKNLSAYRKTARKIPAVLTKVIPTDSELNGGCNAAEEMSHAAADINKISDIAAAKFASIAGKNFLRNKFIARV